MTSNEFNLLDEPWIPCLFRGESRVTDLSIRELFRRASEIVGICHASPIVNLTLHRLLAALIHSALRGPGSVAELRALLADPNALTSGRIEAYLRDYHERFFLFGDRPFLQDPSLSSELAADREQPLGIEKLRRETAAPSEVTLFDHTIESDANTLTPAEAARHLIAAQFFAIQDGSGYKTSPLMSGVASMALGNSLRETLLLNLLPYNVEQPIKARRIENDAPHWEHDNPLPAAIPDGWLDYVTRPYRRLLLVHDASGVSKVYWKFYRGTGADLDGDWRAGLRDPWLAFKASDKGLAPVQLRAERAVWRDAEAIIQQYVDRGRNNPGYARLLARFQSHEGVIAWGVAAQNNSIKLWREIRLPMGHAYAENQELRSILGSAIAVAEQAGRHLQSALNELAKYTSQTIRNALGAERRYWAALDVPFRRFMRELPDGFADDAGLAARTRWAADIRRAAMESFEFAASAVESAGRGWRAAAQARPAFLGRLRQLLEEFAPSTEEVPV